VPRAAGGATILARRSIALFVPIDYAPAAAKARSVRDRPIGKISGSLSEPKMASLLRRSRRASHGADEAGPHLTKVRRRPKGATIKSLQACTSRQIVSRREGFCRRDRQSFRRAAGDQVGVWQTECLRGELGLSSPIGFCEQAIEFRLPLPPRPDFRGPFERLQRGPQAWICSERDAGLEGSRPETLGHQCNVVRDAGPLALCPEPGPCTASGRPPPVVCNTPMNGNGRIFGRARLLSDATFNRGDFSQSIFSRSVFSRRGL